jgi:hypothetical protein
MDNPMEYGGQFLEPAVYVDRFMRIRDAIKSVSSPLGEQVVLLGPTSGFNTSYLAGMLQNLELPDVDGFAIHAYGLNPNLPVEDSLSNFAQAYQGHLAVIDQFGFTYTPAFITEYDRCADPPNDPIQEPVSAQFLHRAYDVIDGWNGTPGNHPIIGCMWFIYPDDGAWGCYSILRHKAGPRGQDVNLWDAFQYAASKEYPAPPILQALYVSPLSFSHVRVFGETISPEALGVMNAGADRMDYTLEEDAAWLSLGSTSGSSSSERDLIDIDYDLQGLLPGTYDATITVTAPGAADSPTEVPVAVRILPYPADLDADFDVDADDFGLFQACLTGPGEVQNDPDCELARLDGDPDVDPDDVEIFLGCLTGADLPADPDCVDP